MLLTKFACPHCEAVLKSAAGVQTGKTLVCPKCKEPFTVAAAGSAKQQGSTSGKGKSDQVQRSPSGTAKRTRKSVPQDDEDAPLEENGEDQDEVERSVPKKKKKKGKRQQKASSSPLLIGLLIGGAVLLLAGGGVGVYFLTRGKAPVNSSPVAQNSTNPPPTNNIPQQPKPNGNPGGTTPNPNPNPNPAPAALKPSQDPGAAEMAQRMEGRWVAQTGTDLKVTYDYRRDGTFTLYVVNGTEQETSKGTWTFTFVQTNPEPANVQLKRAGTATTYFKPEFEPVIFFYGPDVIQHGTPNGLMRCIREGSGIPTKRDPAVMEAENKAMEVVARLGGKTKRGESLPGSPVTTIDLTLENVRQTAATDQDLAAFAKLVELEQLLIGYNQITDAGLVHLSGLTRLHMLYLSDLRITDAGLASLKGLTQLEVLGLGNTGITDAGLVHLKNMTKLQNLSLNRTKISDAGLQHLRDFKNLKELNLLDTKVTPAGVQSLQQALPGVKIYSK